MNQPYFYTVDELTKILRLGRNNVYKLVKDESFPKIIIGKKIVIPANQFHIWVEQHLGHEIELIQ